MGVRAKRDEGRENTTIIYGARGEADDGNGAGGGVGGSRSGGDGGGGGGGFNSFICKLVIGSRRRRRRRRHRRHLHRTGGRNWRERDEGTLLQLLLYIILLRRDAVCVRVRVLSRRVRGRRTMRG